MEFLPAVNIKSILLPLLTKARIAMEDRNYFGSLTALHGST